MKTFLIKSALFILIGIFPISCKKYEEGPWFSFRGVDNRIEGFWELEYLFINDVDSTAAVKSQLCDGLLELSIPYQLNHQGEWKISPDTNVCKQCKGDWAFSKDKKTLYIGRSNTDTCEFNFVGPFLSSNYVNWEIEKLTFKQLWLSTVFNGQNCWAHFKKVDYP